MSIDIITPPAILARSNSKIVGLFNRLQENKPANDTEKNYIAVFYKMKRRYRNIIPPDLSWNLCFEALLEFTSKDEMPTPTHLKVRCDSRHKDFYRSMKRLRKYDQEYKSKRNRMTVEDTVIYRDILEVFRKREPILFVVLIMRRDGYTREEVAELLTNLLGSHYDATRIRRLFEEALVKIAELAR